MAVNSKDIEILWKQYSEDEVNKGWDGRGSGRRGIETL